ncbi:TetR/AcrR family transcriptional regulator [Nocardia sp. NPDC004860]|uniref:TetR/AcrR family transcriptional regulator n=1 Tax=Nocardia sp. NPDC004860 TaxID=3154557 RepID=UPI0033BAD57E
MTAEQRGEQMLAAAIGAFAEYGYAGTGTDEIARRAGISQAYVIRLCGTKQRLFLAALERAYDSIEETLRTGAATGTTSQQRLAAMGQRYHDLLAHTVLPRIFLQGIAAAADPAIGEAVRRRSADIYALIRELTGASVLESRCFIAAGILLSSLSCMGVAGPDGVTVAWAAEILDSS